MKRIMSIGTWGGKGGNIWDDGVYTGIRQIILAYGDAIDSIMIEYDNNGSSIWLKHGGTGGNTTEKIQFDYPTEILTAISGHYDVYLRSLTFKSNLKQYGPYGVQHGIHFSLSLVEKNIVGFHGRSGWYLDCMGVYVSNVSNSHRAIPPKGVLVKNDTINRGKSQGSEKEVEGTLDAIVENLSPIDEETAS